MQLILKNASYRYRESSRLAVENVSLTFDRKEFVALVGHTGSGKSTLIQLLNGLLMPTEGQVLCDGEDISAKDYPLASLRKKVGLVFQYPEHQLFEMTVLKDVCFGPKNLHYSTEEQEKAAKEALLMVGIDEADFEKSPFELSGGEKRRVAIAGVLAMKPDILILDEPTAGLDPEGRVEILELLHSIYEKGTTVLLVTHNMEDVAGYADRVIVMKRGHLSFDGTPRELFTGDTDLKEYGLLYPNVISIMQALRKKGLDVRTDCLTLNEAKEEILKKIKR